MQKIINKTIIIIDENSVLEKMCISITFVKYFNFRK